MDLKKLQNRQESSKKISKNAYKKFFKTFYTSHLSTNTLTLNVHECTKYNHGSSLGHRTHQKSNYYSFYYALNVFIWVIFDRKRPFHILASLIIVLNFLHKWPFRSENDSKWSFVLSCSCLLERIWFCFILKVELVVKRTSDGIGTVSSLVFV